MLDTLFAIVFAFFFGISVVVLFRPASIRSSELPFAISLSLGIGTGVSSCLFFLWISIFHRSPAAFVETEMLLLILLGTCANFARSRARRWATESQSPHPEAPPARRLKLIVAAGFIAALVVAAIAFTRLSIASPHGSFDAWGIWNLHAKFLFVNDQHWHDGFSQDLASSHPDYPLLVPASIARCWSYSAGENTTAPISIAALFSFTTVALLVSALFALTRLSQGLLAGTILLSTPFFVILGAAQYADVPLGFFMLATIVLFSLAKQARGTQILAGITAGMAAWTKNEGTLFVVAALFAHLIANLRTRNWDRYLRELSALAAGLLPILAVLLYFKSSIGTPNDLFSQPETLIHRLTELSRYRTIFKSLLAEVFNFGAWFVSIIPCVAFYVLLVGSREDAREHQNTLSYLALALTAAGYLTIYVIAPFSLDWLLASSLNRLFIQLWPSILFLIFLRAQTPEELSSL